MFYCPSCRQNLDASLKKNHNYQPFHKKWRDELIDKVVTRVTESRFFLKNVMRSKPGLEESFNCPFCEETIEQSQNKTICFAFFKHLSQASHIDRTASYINTTGAPEYVIQKCSITKEEFRMYVHKSSKLLREDAPAPAVYPLDESDAAPLPQVFVPLPPPVVQAPAPATPAPPTASYKTYISKDGILQNASGFHEGKRVWGGGIVRVPKEEWVAWPIDLESVELQPKVRAPAISDEAPRVATEYATGEGVSFLGSHTLLPGEGNVYTGAKPPWEMDDDATTSTPVAGPQPRGVPAAAASTVSVQSRPDRNKRSRNDEETNPDTWLPNFGGTFHIGSRRDFKAAFREELETEYRHKLAEGDAGPPVLSYTSRRAQATGAATAAPEQPMLQPFVARPSVPATAGTALSPAPPPAVPHATPAALAPIPPAAPLAPYVSSRASRVAAAAPPRDVPPLPAPVPAAAAPPPVMEPAVVAKVALSEAMQRKREELIKRAQGLS